MTTEFTRNRRTAKRAAAILLLVTTATIAAEANASAASMAPATTASQPATLQPGQGRIFGTALLGETSFCAQNSSGSTGRMYVASWAGAGDGPSIDIPPRSTRCHTGWYWAVPAKVNNVGSVPLDVTVTP
jgi:hypothetical protein